MAGWEAAATEGAEAGVGVQIQVLLRPASAQLLWASVSPDIQHTITLVTSWLLPPGYLVPLPCRIDR